jgi:1-acyl-sn-glycerol-3-phosphate acyltransferase
MLAFCRTLLFIAIATLLAVIYGVLSLVLGGLSQVNRHRIIISWCHLVIGCAKYLCGLKYRVQGLEHLQQLSRPFVVLSKHQSTWETLYFQMLFFPATTVLKKQLLSIPFFGWGLRGLRPIAIDRDNPREALRQVKSLGVEALGQGMNVIIFPEGTRMVPGERGKYARSGADIAIEAGVPILPIAMNAGVYWQNNAFAKLPGVIDVVIGEPLGTTGKTSRELTDQVENWIESVMDSLPKGISSHHP